MNTFEITVQRKLDSSWPVVSEQCESGAFLPVRVEATLDLDLMELTSQGTPRDYGVFLGKALFRDEQLRFSLIQALNKNPDPLHVTLFVEDAELKGLRWERLCYTLDGRYTGRWDFLAMNQRVPFSLYLPSATDQCFPPIGRRDLRALVVVASPQEQGNDYGLKSFDVAATVAGVRAALGEIETDVLAAAAEAIDPPTLDKLCDWITARRYTLLHIVCHGAYRPAIEETVLYLADADGGIDAIPGSRLFERLGRARGARGLPYFAFLSACESAVPEASAALGGLAQRLVQAPELGMPAVLAMTEKVSVVTAQKLAERFYQRLREHGHPDLALVEACAGLGGRPDIHVPALYSRLGGRPLFSMEDHPLTNTEIDDGLTRVRNFLVTRAPVLLPEFDGHAETLRRTLTAESAALSKEARAERDAALDAVGNICDDALEVTFASLALGHGPPAYQPACPFKGLYPFRPEDQPFFFGREALIAKLEGRLTEANFLAVLGPSGSGKSSVVLAGLAPVLRAKEPGFRMADLTPGNDPLASLDAALGGTQTLSLLVVDQFEELFTLGTDPAKRLAFLDRVLRLPDRMRVVITMRADFWGECAPFPALKDRMQACQELIAPMDAAELRRAIEMQAAKVGLRFEADLSNTLLDEVQGEPGAMPLLQHALRQLWDRRHGRWLRAKEYRALGGVKQAIAETADAEFRKLSAAEQAHMRDIFVRLTRLDGEAVKAEDRRDTRQRVGLGELTPDGARQADTQNLVKRLADARLVVTSVNAATQGQEVEVAHEALIRHWPRLRIWLDEDRAAWQLRAGIHDAERQWQESDCDRNLLAHRGPRLIEAEKLCGRPRFLNEEEKAYVNACVADREEGIRAEEARQRQLAEERQRRMADGASRELAARAIAELSADPELGLLLAMRAARAAETAEAEDAVRQALLASHVRGSLAVHTSYVNTIAFSPDGAALLTASGDGTALIWKLGTREYVTLAGHAGAIATAAFSADGQLIVTAGADKTARLWQRRSGGWETRAILPHTSAVAKAVFSPDGRFVVTQCSDSTAVLWRTDTDAGAAEFTKTNVQDVAFSPDGLHLATANTDDTASVHDARTGRARANLRGHDGPLTTVAFSPNGELLVTAGWDTTGRVWNWARQKELAVLRGHDEAILMAAFSPDGKCVVTAGTYLDNTVRLWEPATGRQLVELRGHGSVVFRAAFRPDSHMVATASADNTARLWDVATGDVAAVLTGHTGQIRDIAFSPDGRFVATASWDGQARWWQVPRGTVEMRGHERDVHTAEFSGDGARMITAGADGTARVWDAGSGQAVGPPLAHRGSFLNCAAFSHDRRRAVLALNGNGKMRHGAWVWEADADDIWHCRVELPHKFQVRDAEFSPDDRHILTSSYCTARLWNAATGELVREVANQEHEINSAAFSPDGHWVAVACWDNHAWVWPATGSAPGIKLERHRGTVYTAMFSPDGRLVVTASGDNTACLWDWRERRLVAELRGHRRRVFSAAFSPDGARVLTASEDQSVRLWDVKTAKVVAEMRGHTRQVNYAAFSPDGSLVVTASSDRTAHIMAPDIRPALADLMDLARTRVTRKLSPEERRNYLHDDGAE